MGLKLDTCVLRVTEDKERIFLAINQLEIGDKFSHENILWEIRTISHTLGGCCEGIRVQYQGRWYVVAKHGLNLALFPLPENNPFATWGKGCTSTFPHGFEEVQVLSIEKLSESKEAAVHETATV